jgi:hypothetical protein
MSVQTPTAQKLSKQGKRIAIGGELDDIVKSFLFIEV